jgi:hypothetical protein
VKLGRRRHLRKSLGRPSPEAFFPVSTCRGPPARQVRRMSHRWRPMRGICSMPQPPQSRLPALYNATPAKRVRAGGKAIPSAITTHPCVFATSPPLVRAGALPRMRGKTVLPRRPRRDAYARCCPHGRPAPGHHPKAAPRRSRVRDVKVTEDTEDQAAGSSPRRGPPGCPRRGLPAPTARPRRCGAQRRHRPRRPPSTVLLGVSPADAHHGPAARVTATERYTHMATLQMTDASQRMSELGYRDERSCNPSCHLWLRHKSGPVPECSGRGPVVCGGSGI